MPELFRLLPWDEQGPKVFIAVGCCALGAFLSAIPQKPLRPDAEHCEFMGNAKLSPKAYESRITAR